MKEKMTMKIQLNKVTVVGYVSQTFKNESGTVLSFSLGIDDSYKDRQRNEWVNRTNWIPCRIFDQKRIEKLYGKINKCIVLIDGELKSSKREVDGKERYEPYLIPNRIQIIEDRKTDEDVSETDNISLAGIDDNY